ncbi:MAG: cytochrome P450 [Actinomycetota bacterium]|nr:cytochrome P450 [Actinomycetota bacterium]
MGEPEAVQETTSEPVGLNPFEAGFAENPYRQYRRLREAEPVHRTPFGPFMLTRWVDVHQLLRDPSTSVEERNVTGETRRTMIVEADPGREERGSKGILNIDPPDHTRLRRLVSKAFTPRTIERLRPQVQRMVDDLLDDIALRGGTVDLISDLAFPLPFAVISEMLGMPEGNREQLRRWSHTLTQILDPILAETNLDAILEASDRMNEVVTAAIDWKRGRPDDDDLFNALLRAEDDGDVLSDAELIDNVTLLYLAGHETTVNLIGNGINALLQNPLERRRLEDDPTLDANAVEELLRYDSPVQFSRRIALEPMNVGGQLIEPGELLMTGLGAANHDPDKFGPDADALDLGRSTAREHVSFGSGVHHCLGAALARLEGQVAIGSFVRRFPRAEPDGEPQWNSRIVLRGLDHLPVTLGQS